METFQIGRATRLLKIAPQARRSFILKMIDKTVKKAPGAARGAAWVADFGIEAVEGGAIEWLQTVHQMSANKAIKEGYGNNPKEALEALAHELGPIPFLPLRNMFSEEIGMSDEAKTAFLLGMSGEAGFGVAGGSARVIYEDLTRPKEIQYDLTPEDTPPVTPSAPFEMTDGDQALNLVQDSMRDQFVDLIDRQEASTITDKVTLTNGNQIIEFYQKNYHPEDYERNSLVSIKGITRLVA